VPVSSGTLLCTLTNHTNLIFEQNLIYERRADKGFDANNDVAFVLFIKYRIRLKYKRRF